MNAFLTLWFSPRETTRSEADLPGWLHLAIMWAWGAGYALERAMFEGRNPHASAESQIAMSLFVGLFGGVSYFWMLSTAIYLTGSWFKGRATNKAIRHALVVGAIPDTLAAGFLVMMAFGLGRAFFDDADIIETLSASNLAVTALFLVLVFVLKAWSLVATAHTLAEVQGYESAWKGWCHSVVAFLCMVIVVAVPVFVYLMLVSSSR